jgi:hypothetical protein
VDVAVAAHEGRRAGAVLWVRGVAVSDGVGASILATARFQRPPVTPDTEISTIRRCQPSQREVYVAPRLDSLHQATP